MKTIEQTAEYIPQKIEQYESEMKEASERGLAQIAFGIQAKINELEELLYWIKDSETA